MGAAMARRVRSMADVTAKIGVHGHAYHARGWAIDLNVKYCGGSLQFHRGGVMKMYDGAAAEVLDKVFTTCSEPLSRLREDMATWFQARVHN